MLSAPRAEKDGSWPLPLLGAIPWRKIERGNHQRSLPRRWENYNLTQSSLAPELQGPPESLHKSVEGLPRAREARKLVVVGGAGRVASGERGVWPQSSPHISLLGSLNPCPFSFSLRGDWWGKS